MVNINTLGQWRYMKKKLLEGLDCVLCGKPATELHHPQSIEDYDSRYEYFNAENQIPLCRDCHYSKAHIMSKGKYNPKTGITWSICKGGGFGDK